MSSVLYDTHPADFIALLKPRVMSLSIFTALCGMLLAPGTIHPLLGIGSILCIAIGAGAAGCLNMWCEMHRDALMKRTKTRPLPAGRLDPNSALAMGLLLSFFSVFLLGLIANWTAAFWLFATIACYVLIYTMILKTRTPHNIVIGGASGALPPVIGWACVTGSADLASFGLFLVIFMWTPAHFWALCMDQSDDYAAAGFPMMPSVRGVASTKRSIFLYAVLTVISSFALIWMLDLGTIYLGGAILLNGYFLQQAYGVLKDSITGRRLFFVSIFYLFFLFLLMLVDRWSLVFPWH